MFVAEILSSTVMLLFPIGVMFLVLHARSERQQLREFTMTCFLDSETGTTAGCLLDDTNELTETMDSFITWTLLLLLAVGCVFLAVRLVVVLMTAYHYTYCIRATQSPANVSDKLD